MALGWKVRVNSSLFPSNDSNAPYVGVTGITFSADQSTMTLTGMASASNFGASTIVNLLSAGKIEIYRTATEFPGNSAGSQSG